MKATPLITIGVALALGFRAGVWNIGAEGQLVMGGLCGGAVALAFWGVDGFWVMPLVLLGGSLGGLLWGAIPAFLKVRFNANEILVSLMLTYVAILLLSVMVHGPSEIQMGLIFLKVGCSTRPLHYQNCFLRAEVTSDLSLQFSLHYLGHGWSSVGTWDLKCE